jgi:hypothetical protein
VSLPVTLNQFLGPPSDWMYFSHARLRHKIAENDRQLSEMQAALARATELARRQGETDSKIDDGVDSFAELWGIRSERSTLPAGAKPFDQEAAE